MPAESILWQAPASQTRQRRRREGVSSPAHAKPPYRIPPSAGARAAASGYRRLPACRCAGHPAPLYLHDLARGRSSAQHRSPQVQKAANSCNSVFPARYVGALRGLRRYPGASILGGPIGFRLVPHEATICRHPAPQIRFPNLALRSSDLRSSALCHSAVRGTARKREKPQTTSGGRTEPQAEARPASRFRRELAGWHAGQKYVLRAAWTMRRISAPQVPQGCPARSYTANRSW